MSKGNNIPPYRGPLYKEKIIWRISCSASQQDIRRNKGKKKIALQRALFKSRVD
jgi:hypothetical protein